MAKGPEQEAFVSIETQIIDILKDGTCAEARWTPPMDCYETKEELRIELHLPGIKIEDLRINLYNEEIRIRGKRTMDLEENVCFHRIERPFGTFERTIHLPFHPVEDNIKASMKDGVLRITIRKENKIER